MYVLEVLPFADHGATGMTVNRSPARVPGATLDARFPTLQRGVLSNGLRIVLAERHDVPVVNLRLQLDAGYATDPGESAGSSTLVMNMLAEGTATRSSLQIREELAWLGAVHPRVDGAPQAASRRHSRLAIGGTS